MILLFSDLCEKEVVNCSDGAILGNVTDIEICVEECKVTAIFIQCKKGLFSKENDIRIPWEKIEKVGKDVIIVNYCPSPFQGKCHEKPPKKFC